MKLSILQAALVLLSVNLHTVFGQTSTSCTTVVFSQLPGQQFTTLAAGDKLVGTTVGACQASCHSDNACIGFDFRTTPGATAECFRNTDGTKTFGTSNPTNFDHYRKVIDCYSYDRTRKCTPVQRYVGLKNMAGLITAGAATSEALCGQLCVANQLCKAFGWDDNAKDCKISTTLVVNSATGTYKAFDGGYPTPPTCQPFTDPVQLINPAQLGSCTGSYVKTANRQYQEGMGTVTQIATETLCQQACDANINCFGVNWNTLNQQCNLLFDPRSVYVAINNWDFYQKRYTCQSASANEECLYDAMGTYAPVLLSSLRSASPQSTATLEQCSQFLENYQTNARKGIMYNPGSSACYLFTATGASPFDTLAMAAPGEASFKYVQCQPTSTPSGNVCKTAYTTVGNSKLNNAVGLPGNPNSLAACEAACTALTSCLAYHFGNNICGATTTVSLILPRLQTTADANYKTYVRQQKCLGCNYQRVVDRSGAGAQVAQPNYQTETSCLEACAKTSTSCKAIEFNPVTLGCFHFSTVTAYNLLLGSKNIYIYQATCEECSVQYTRSPSNTISGGNTVPQAGTFATENDCKAVCTNDRNCFQAEYDSASKGCILNFAVGTVTAAAGSTVVLTKKLKCTSCEFTMTPQTEMLAPRATMSGFSSIDACVQGCDEDSACKYTTFDFTTNTCYHLTNTGIIQANNNYVTWSKADSTCAECRVKFTTYPNQGMPLTPGTLASGVNTESDCKKACLQDSTCIFADYIVDKNICNLYSSAGTRTPVPNTNNIQKGYDCSGCTFALYPGRLGGAGLLKPGSKDVVTCLSGCQKESSCKAAAFSTKTSTCYTYVTDDTSNLPVNLDFVYYSGSSCKACVPTYTRETGKTQGGPSTANRPVTEDACKNQCNNSPTCIAANYFITTQTCYLYTSRQTATIAQSQFIYLTKVFNCDGCNYVPYPSNVPNSAGTVRAGIVKDTNCLAECQRDQTCKGASFEFGTIPVCKLYTVDERNNLIASTLTFFYSAQSCKDCAAVYTSVANTYRATGSSGTLPGATEATCTSYCTSDRRCVAAVLRSTNCEKFYTVSLATDLSVVAGSTYLKKTMKCSGLCAFSPVPEVNAGGGALQAAYKDETTCLAECAKAPTCKALQFNTKQQSCEFFTEDKTGTQLSVNKDAFFWTTGACKDCAQVITTRPDTVMNGGTQITNTGQAQCKSICEQDVTCVAMSVRNQDQACWKHIVTAATSNTATFTLYTKSKTCSGCEFLPYPNNKATVAGVGQVAFKSEETCLSGCAKEITCKAVNFNTKTNLCSFYTAHQTAQTPSLEDIYYSGEACKVCVSKFLKRTGISYQVVGQVAQASDEASCGTACINNCIAYEWNNILKSCQLYENKPNAGVAIATANLYERYRDCEGCQFNPNPLRSATGGTVKSYPNLLDCMNNCQKDPKCYAITFNDKSNECQFFEQDLSGSLLATADTTYWDAAPCKVCQESFVVQNQNRISSAVGQFSKAQTADTCKDECKKSTNCVAAQFNSAIAQCYLFTDANYATTADANYNIYSKTRNCAGCNFVPFPGKKGAGGTVNVASTTLVQCLSNCQKDGTCRGADFNDKTGTCMFYASDIKSSTTADKDTTYWSAGACKECTFQYVATPDAALPQGTENTNVLTPEACKTLCDANRLCFAVDYSAGSAKCYIHTEASQQVDTNTAQGFTSYAKFLDCDGCKFTPYPSRGRSGGVVAKQFSTDVACANGCTEDNNCQAILFNIQSNECSFFTTAGITGLTPVANNIYWSAGVCKSCSIKYVEYPDVYLSSSSTNLNVANNDACKSVCTLDQSCVAVDYYTVDKTCYVYNSLSQLNKANTVGTWINYQKSYDCGDCKFSPNPFKTGGTGGIVQTTLKTEKDCIAGCSSASLCRGCDYNRLTQACRFFNVVAATLGVDPNSIFWQTSGCRDCAPEFKVTGSASMPGTYQTNAAQTVGDCQNACLRISSCVAFDFVSTQATKCLIYTIPGVPNVVTGLSSTNYLLQRNCDGCRYNPHPERAVVSTVPGTLQPVYKSLAACLSACTKNAECQAIAWKRNNDCYFYNTDVSQSTLLDKTSVVWISDNCKKCTFDYNTYPTMYVPSASYVPGLDTADKCKSFCTVDRTCVSVDFDAANRNCYKNQNPQAQRAATSTRTSYWKLQKCGECNFYAYPNQAGSSGALQGAEKTVFDCLKACTDRSTCFSAYFDFKNSGCYFMASNDTTNLVNNADANFYSPRNCKDCMYKLIATPDLLWNAGSDIGTSFTAATCQAACLSDLDCMAADFSLPTTRCFKHRVATTPVPGRAGWTHYDKVIECEGCQYTPTLNRRPSALSAPVLAASVNDPFKCAKECKKSASCQSLSFNDARQCRLFNTKLTALQLTSDITTDVYTFKKCAGCTSRFDENRDKFTQSGSRTGSTSQVSCQQDCVNNANCVAYDFHPTSGCYTINSPTVNVVSRPGWSHFQRVMDCDGCKYTPYVGKRGAGGTGQPQHSSLNDCLSACTGDESCGSADFSRINNLCNFFSGDPKTSLITDAATTHYSPKNCKQCKVMFERKSNMLAAGTVAVSNIRTADACQDYCKANELCVGVSFNRATLICYSYASAPIAATADASNNWDIYLKYRDCAGCRYNPYPQRQALSGNGIAQPGFRTIVECMKGCEEHQTCVSLDFHIKTFACTYYATDLTPNLIANADSNHWSLSTCTSQGCGPVWQKSMNMQAAGALLKTGVNSEPNCRSACSKDANCLGYNFNNNGRTCSFVNNPTITMNGLGGVDFYRSEDMCVNTLRGNCTYEYLGQRLGTGSPGADVPVNSLATCERECLNQAACKGVSYNIVTGKCYIYNTDNQMTTATPSPSWVSYRIRECKTIQDCPKWVDYVNFHVTNGFEQKGANAPKTVDACRTACVANPQCVGVDTDTLGGVFHCYIHQDPNALNSRQPLTGVTFNYLQTRCGQQSTGGSTGSTKAPSTVQTGTQATPCRGQWQDLRNTRARGATHVTFITGDSTYNSLGYQTGRTQCITQCYNDPKCVGFELDRSSSAFFCWLYSSASQIAVANRETSAVNDLYILTSRSCGVAPTTAFSTRQSTFSTRPASSTQPGCEIVWREYRDMQAQGARNDRQPGLTLAQCQARCVADTTCVGIDFTQANLNYACWYHSSLALMNARTRQLTTNQYVLIDRCKRDGATTARTAGPTTVRTTQRVTQATQTTRGTGCRPTWTVRTNYQGDGATFVQRQIDLATCQLNCVNNVLCVGVDYTTKPGNWPCWIHTQASSLSPTGKPGTQVNQYAITRCNATPRGNTVNFNTNRVTFAAPQAGARDNREVNAQPDWTRTVGKKQSGGQYAFIPNSSQFVEKCKEACENKFARGCCGVDVDVDASSNASTCWLHMDAFDPNGPRSQRADNVDHYEIRDDSSKRPQSCKGN